VKKIQLRDFKSRVSAIVKAAAKGKPVVIARPGKPDAVLLGFEDYKRLSNISPSGRRDGSSRRSAKP
jgi:prevent-host-death family protein